MNLKISNNNKTKKQNFHNILKTENKKELFLESKKNTFSIYTTRGSAPIFFKLFIFSIFSIYTLKNIFVCAQESTSLPNKIKNLNLYDLDNSIENESLTLFESTSEHNKKEVIYLKTEPSLLAPLTIALKECQFSAPIQTGCEYSNTIEKRPCRLNMLELEAKSYKVPIKGNCLEYKKLFSRFILIFLIISILFDTLIMSPNLNK